MKKPSEPAPQWDQLHEKIIGLGEKSIRKSYYPELQRKVRELEQEIAEHKQHESELQRSYENRDVANYLLKLSLQEISLKKLCQQTVEKLFSLSWLADISGVAIFLLKPGSTQLILTAEKGSESGRYSPCDQVPVGACLCGLAIAEGKVQYAAKIDERHTLGGPDLQPHGHYTVPILFAGQPLGVICAYLAENHPYDPLEVNFFETIANTLAGIVQRHWIVDEKKRYQEMLSQAQKIEAIGTLSGGIAHDFNNLLAPMLGYAELALRDLDPESRAARQVREVMQAASRARELVRQILTLSHKIEPKLEKLEPIDVAPVVSEVLGLVRASIPTTVNLVSQIESRGRKVVIDPTHLHQIVLNLCTNAYQAMPEGRGEIRVQLKTTQLGEADLQNMPEQFDPGAYLLLKVADTGTGMDQETMARVFDPYFTTKKLGEGTGLGLAVVSGLIKSYRGAISVYSEKGYGSTFNVFLPCGEREAGADDDTDIADLPIGSAHVMVVDDEPKVGELVCDMLESLGYRTRLFLHAEEALDHFKKKPEQYDLVVTDMTMPQLTGLDLFRLLRQCRKDIPVILCTGFSELINEEKALQTGFNKYLMKPVLMSELAFAVHDVLAGK